MIVFYFSLSDHEVEEFSTIDSEKAIFKIEAHVMLPNLIENSLKMGRVVLYICQFDHHIIDMYFHYVTYLKTLSMRNSYVAPTFLIQMTWLYINRHVLP